MKSSVRAFTLVELLVVIAVIGVVAGIAISSMTGIFGKADTAKAERNAQYLVSTFNAARAAGNSTSYPSAAEAITALTTSPGLTGRGQWAGAQFYVSLAPADITEATTRISLGLAGTAAEGCLTIDR
jgi:general secretion pathway protein G